MMSVLSEYIEKEITKTITLAEDLVEHYCLLNKGQNLHHENRPYLHGLIPSVRRSHEKDGHGNTFIRNTGSLVWYRRTYKYQSATTSRKVPIEKYLPGKHRGTARDSVKSYPSDYLARYIDDGREWEYELATRYEHYFKPVRMRLFYLYKLRADIKRTDSSYKILRTALVEHCDPTESLVALLKMTAQGSDIKELLDIEELLNDAAAPAD